MAEFEFTNMVMIHDKSTGRVLVQERIKSWKGIAFPGGHVENGESIYDSAVREVFEETGFTVRNLIPCGFMQWYNNKTNDRYFVFFYKTHDFSGELMENSEEGRNFWVNPEDLYKLNTPGNFKEYLPIFFGDRFTEGFCSWNEETEYDMTKPNPYGIVYR
ncbi:MAG: 8-oxo-dGTP diphosphatase [Clostridiales bacterium]|jgi:8-oxo-dGTP diphosphatase|nr:8-oxo-dGTP diphosphatase [Clostridiales bacterium]